MQRLRNLTPGDRVIVFAPHPDDETLAAGGLLQKAAAAGAATRVVFVTAGDNNPWPQRAVERRWRIGPAERRRWGARRREEAVQALACLGLPPESAVFLGYPDQGLTELLLRGEGGVTAALAGQLLEWHPTLVAGPAVSDLHPDHNALAVLLQLAWEPPQAAEPGFAEIHYLVHGPSAAADRVYLPLLPEERERKRQAILCHRSQLVLSRSRFLAYARDAEVFVAGSGARMADGPHPVRRVRLEGSALVLETALPPRWSSLAPRRVYVVGENGQGPAVRRSLPFPGRPAEVSVRDTVSGAILTQARFSGRRGRGSLRIPLAALQPARRLFVKLQRGLSFFDDAGWREFLVPRQGEGEGLAAGPPRSEAPGRPVSCCVIPCYNVGSMCAEVVREARAFVDYVVVVDDGSTDETGGVLRSLAAESGGQVRLISLAVNSGKGAALLAAFRYALEELPFDVLVTLDGDRQHRPADIPRLLSVWEEDRPALVLGERMEIMKMPLRSKFGNVVFGSVLRWLYPAGPIDTQSGFRALDRGFVEEVVRRIRGERYQTELYMLLLVLELQSRVRTIAIPTIYLPRNASSHFRPLVDSVRICWALLVWCLRYRRRLHLPVPNAG